MEEEEEAVLEGIEGEEKALEAQPGSVNEMEAEEAGEGKDRGTAWQTEKEEADTQPA